MNEIKVFFLGIGTCIVCFFAYLLGRNRNNVEIGSLTDIDGLAECERDCNEAGRNIDTARRNNTEIAERLDDSIRRLKKAVKESESSTN